MLLVIVDPLDLERGIARLELGDKGALERSFWVRGEGEKPLMNPLYPTFLPFKSLSQPLVSQHQFGVFALEAGAVQPRLLNETAPDCVDAKPDEEN